MKNNNFTIALVGIASLLLTASMAQPLAEKRVATMDAQSALAKNDRLFFIENKGQWHSDVLYLCRMGGLDVWITKYGVNYTFYKIEKNPNASANREADFPKGKFDNEELENRILLGHRVLFELQNANSKPSTEGRKKQHGYYNYLIGNDPSKHATYVGLYKEVLVKDVYKGIDIRYYFDRGFMRYDFVVHPGADPSQISFKLRGQYKDYVKEGALCYTTRFGEVQMAELKSIQDGKAISSNFIKNGDIWNIQLSHYDKTKMLIIDPLIYSTYIGGSGGEVGFSIVDAISVDISGNAYITGHTWSTDYDVTIGVFQSIFGGGSYDVFVTKLNATGTDLVYSSYIGGSDGDAGCSVAVDFSNNVYITGWTYSSDYNITIGAFQTVNNGNDEVFVTKLNATGTALVYSTYIGGSNIDVGYSIAIDITGNAYITGKTSSTDYDITIGVFQPAFGGGSCDAFVMKLNATGTGLIYSTYIGGNNDDVGFSIDVDNIGNVYVAGFTQSTDFDVTVGAFQTTNGGNIDVFVTKLNATGTDLIYSTYIGGSDYDRGYSMDIDSSGNAYIIGSTSSTDYDVTPGAFQTMNEGMVDVFVTKLNATGTSLVYSTYIGGNKDDEGYSIVIDSLGNAYITGKTNSSDYDVTVGALQMMGLPADAFVSKLNVNGTAMIYSTYIGGSGYDIGYSITIDVSGNCYLMGSTSSIDYYVTPGAFQSMNGGGDDVFVTKLDLATGIEENSNLLYNIHIYPNPNNGQFTIETERGGVFELMDVMGKVINVYEVKESKAIIQENLPAGFYFIREKNTGAVSKLVIE